LTQRLASLVDLSIVVNEHDFACGPPVTGI
jgi:hypothetical protein